MITTSDLLAFQIAHYKGHLKHKDFKVRQYARQFLNRLKREQNGQN